MEIVCARSNWHRGGRILDAANGPCVIKDWEHYILLVSHHGH
jgi:hypothetical protein